MEEQTFNNDNREMRITEQGRAFLLTASKWAKFLAIIGFIGIGLATLGFLIALAGGSAAMSAASKMGNPMGMLGTAGMTFYFIMMLVILLICFIPMYFLFSFSVKTQQAIRDNDSGLMTESFMFLKRYYKFIGILTIVILFLYLMTIPFLIIFLSPAVSALGGM